MKRPTYSRVCLACLSLLAGSSIAHAEDTDGDVFVPYVGYGFSSDDNLSRAPDGGDRVSDTWQTRTFGFRVDKTISRQHLSANLSVNDSKYDHFSNFDNSGKNGTANWGWEIGNHLTGNVGTSYSEDLTPFETSGFNGALLPPSIRTQQRKYVDGAWQFHPAWRVTGALSRYEVNYEGSPAQRLQLDTTEVAIDDYTARATATFGLLLRHSDGKYPNGINGDYSQDELKGNLRWQVTGKTNIQFIGGWAKRDFDDSQRDFTGPDGRLTVNWNVTGKTALTFVTWRELGSANLYSNDPASGSVPIVVDPGTTNGARDLSANYSRNTGASLSANWQATAKTSVDASVLSENRDYNGVGSAPSDRSDRYRKNTIGITFLPFRQLNIRASVYQQTLDSNIAQATYRTKGFQIVTRYEF